MFVLDVSPPCDSVTFSVHASLFLYLVWVLIPKTVILILKMESWKKKKKKKLWCFSDTSRHTSTNGCLPLSLVKSRGILSLKWTQICVSSGPCAALLYLQQLCVFVWRLEINPSWSPARINAPQVNLNFRAARPAPPASLDWLHWCEHYNCWVTAHGV